MESQPNLNKSASETNFINNKTVIYAVIAIIAVAGLVYYFNSDSAKVIEEGEKEAVSQEVSSRVTGASDNPTEDLPKTNPFEETSTNPFDSYKNPFDR
jgi:hypothetical protein